MRLFDHIVTGDTGIAELSNICYWLSYEADYVEIRDIKKPLHSRFVTRSDNVNIHYDYGADYYFFESCEC